MSGLAQGLMDFSHREARPSRFRMDDLLRRTVDLVRPQARFRGVDFDMETQGEVPEVEMDPGQIQQAFLTLLRRAAGAPEAGAVRVRTRADRHGRLVAVLISTGDADEAFLVERPASRVSRRHGGDPELGAVRRIVERHQGRLHELADEESHEAFRVVLPAA
jgi:signal transduction histidine kinase